MKMSGFLRRRGLILGVIIAGIIGAGIASAQRLPDLSGKWTGFTPTGVNGGVNTFTQNGNQVSMRHPNGQTTGGAHLTDASTLVVPAWNSTGRINAARTRITFQGGSMDGWTFVRGEVADPKLGGSSDSIEGTYLDQSDSVKKGSIWEITKKDNGQFQAIIRHAPPEDYKVATLLGDYSDGTWEGKITLHGCTFDGCCCATFRLKVSDDRRTISGGYTYWNKWDTYNYKLGAKRK